MTTFPNQMHVRVAETIAQTARLAKAAHRRLDTLVSSVSSLSPGSWEPLTLAAGWSNVAGFIPAQVRILQAGQAQVIGHIEGGTTADSTVIATLDAGFFNPNHAHSFTANVLAGASAVSVAGTVSGDSDTSGLADGTINGTTDSDGLADGTIGGTSASASGPGSHSHGGGGLAVNNGHHTHAGNSGSGSLAVADGNHGHGSSALVPATPVNYNTVTLTLNTSGQLVLTNCSSSASQLSFNETLPLVT